MTNTEGNEKLASLNSLKKEIEEQIKRIKNNEICTIYIDAWYDTDIENELDHILENHPFYQHLTLSFEDKKNVVTQWFLKHGDHCDANNPFDNDSISDSLGNILSDNFI